MSWGAPAPGCPMKNLQQMLRELARPEVVEFAMASDRLPCVKIGNKYEPVDNSARTTDAILSMLVAVGGSRYVESLVDQPAVWTARVEALGPVAVQAVMREGRVQVRFALVNRPVAVEPAPAAIEDAPETDGSDGLSDPMLRAAVNKPSTAAPKSPPAFQTLSAVLAAARG